MQATPTITVPQLHRDQRGQTLMEALTVVGVMAIIMMMVAQIFSVSYDVFIKFSARSDNETSAVLAARFLSDITRGADSVLTSRTINGTAYTTSSTVLVLRMPTIDASNNVVPGTFDYVAFYRDGTETTKIFYDMDAATGSQRVDGKHLVTAFNQALYFRYNHSDVTRANRVQVYLVNYQTKRGAAITTKGWTAIFMRNR